MKYNHLSTYTHTNEIADSRLNRPSGLTSKNYKTKVFFFNIFIQVLLFVCQCHGILQDAIIKESLTKQHEYSGQHVCPAGHV